MPVLNDADRIYNGPALAARVYAGANQVWPKGPPPVFDAPAWGTVAAEYAFARTDLITADASGNVSSVAPIIGEGPITNGGNLTWSPRTGVRTDPAGANALDYPTAHGQHRLYRVLTTIVAQPLTVAVVMKLDAMGAADVQAFGDDPGIYTGLIGSGNIGWLMYASSTFPVTNAPLDTAWHVIVGVYNGASSQYWQDGTLRNSGNIGDANVNRLVVGNYGGGGYAIDGAIAHIVWWRGIVANIPGMSASLKAVHGL